MSLRPIIGIPTQTFDQGPGPLPPCWIMSQRYIRVLVQQGAVPWIVPLLPDDPPTMRAIFNQLDGLFLTGGVDVDPSQYGEVPHAYCQRSDLHRDRTEITFLRWAMETRLPVLAVCRGLQVMNVALGGTLYQDLHHELPDSMKHDYFSLTGPFDRAFLAHDVTVSHGTRLRQLLGQPRVRVNSLHHQAVKRLSDDLIESARAPDGVIEGVEGRNGQFLVGVQWHPEELTDHDHGMRMLFASFVDAAAHSGRG